ncbi:MAG: nucleotide pyrophosphohydrolase [Eubacteriales bacterium]|nr:nucleotide pyrophosphohydrolase [Eubacteriales bacterium]
MESTNRHQEVLKEIEKFNKDRHWGQHHSPANLAKSIVLEAAELLENFQWSDEDYDESSVQEELADVLIYSYQLAMRMGWDDDELVMKKIALNGKKYPVE